MKTKNISKSKASMSTLKRLLSYITKRHKFKFVIVLFCILISSLTTVVSSLFIKVVIDDYITPMLSTG